MPYNDDKFEKGCLISVVLLYVVVVLGVAAFWSFVGYLAFLLVTNFTG